MDGTGNENSDSQVESSSSAPASTSAENEESSITEVEAGAHASLNAVSPPEPGARAERQRGSSASAGTEQGSQISQFMSSLIRILDRTSSSLPGTGSLLSENDGRPEIPSLSCKCGSPICFKEDVVTEKYDMLTSHVFSYDLDMFDDVVAPAYSATNPGDHRFDVVCLKPKEVTHRLFIEGTPTADHSWFPPYMWSFTRCLSCGASLGWAFHKEEDSEPAFIGIIVTNLRPKKSKVPTKAELAEKRSLLLEMRSLANDLDESMDEEDDADEEDEGEVAVGAEAPPSTSDEMDEQVQTVDGNNSVPPLQTSSEETQVEEDEIQHTI